MSKIKQQKQNKKVKSEGNISYIGNVTIETKRDNKVLKTIQIHNAGDLPLFKFLVNCLLGNYYGNQAPRYLRTFDINDNATCSAPIPYNKLTYSQTTTSASCTYHFIIPYTNLYSNSESKYLALYNSDNYASETYSSSTPSAHFEILNSSDYIVADGKSNFVITWEMKIQNSQGGE